MSLNEGDEEAPTWDLYIRGAMTMPQFIREKYGMTVEEYKIKAECDKNIA